MGGVTKNKGVSVAPGPSLPRELAKDTGSTVAEINGVWPYRKQTATIYFGGKKMFKVKYNCIVVNFNTQEEAESYIEKNKMKGAEVRDANGALICFYL